MLSMVAQCSSWCRYGATVAERGDAAVVACLAFAKRVATLATESHGDAVEPKWSVRAVLCGDGSVGRSGLELKHGVMYGSSSMRGGDESFWKIDSSTLRVEVKALVSSACRSRRFPCKLAA